jgi:hypothetical protein
MGSIGSSISSSSEEKGEGGMNRGEGSGGIMVVRVQEGCEHMDLIELVLMNKDVFPHLLHRWACSSCALTKKWRNLERERRIPGTRSISDKQKNLATLTTEHVDTALLEPDPQLEPR